MAGQPSGPGTPAPDGLAGSYDNSGERTALYRMYDASGALLYIGISKNFGRRWIEHAKTKPWWRSVDTQTIKWLGSWDSALAAEKSAIQAEQPLHNVEHTPWQAVRIAGETSRRIAGVEPPDESAEWWTVSEVARYLGNRDATVSSYKRRGQMPPADATAGRTCLWRPTTITTWQASRPGKGGRPAKG